MDTGGPTGPTEPPMPTPPAIWCDHGLVVAEIGPVCLALWRGLVSRERFEAQRLGLDRVVKAHPEGAGFLCVVEPTAPIPTADMRRASADMIAIHRQNLRYVAGVVEGKGLRPHLIRAVLTGMRYAITGKIAYSLAATVPEVARHFAEHLPIGSPESFTASVEAARSVLDEVSEKRRAALSLTKR